MTFSVRTCEQTRGISRVFCSFPFGAMASASGPAARLEEDFQIVRRSGVFWARVDPCGSGGGGGFDRVAPYAFSFDAVRHPFLHCYRKISFQWCRKVV